MGRPGLDGGPSPGLEGRESVDSLAARSGADSAGGGERTRRERMARRRSGGTWLPTLGTQPVAGDAENAFSGRVIGSASVVTDGFVTIFPLIPDAQIEGDDANATSNLVNYVGNEYVIKRIVGKAFIARGNPGGELDNAGAVLVGLGLFVARANDANIGGGIDTPIGSATLGERRDNYGPLEVDTIREPWIWRRTWILGSAGNANGIVAGPNELAGQYPCSTALYGSVADGPHIDSRVKRRVSQDNRLWAAIQGVPIDNAGWAITEGTSIPISMFLDYRVFGSLRRARGTSAF